MKKKNNIDRVDEALRHLWLDAGEHAEQDQACEEMNLIIQTPLHTEMPAEQQAKLFSDLFNTMTTVSLGGLVAGRIKSAGIAVEVLAKESGLAVTRIDQLKNDDIYPNSVPVLLLKNLLEKLHISFSLAERGIMKTFDKVQQRVRVPALACRPVFRRSIGKDTADASGALRSKRADLYENKEALYNYLTKLEELMTKD